MHYQCVFPVASSLDSQGLIICGERATHATSIPYERILTPVCEPHLPYELARVTEMLQTCYVSVLRLGEASNGL